ncbi:MAG: CBS domain-containing protein, partial [Actinomycetota bacterium]|nr:CBS domain-containing protein [Actinomycetota bacterium]
MYELEAAELSPDAVPVASRSDSVRQVRARMQDRRFHALHDVVILDHDRVAGLLDLRDVLAAPGDTLVGDLMDSEPPLAGVSDDPNVAAQRMIDRGESSL